MGPKKKGKGKQRKVKKEEPRKPTKSQYVARIAEMNAVLAQARRETFKIEDVYFGTEKKYEEVQEDMADVMKYLEHEIQICEDEIAVYELGIAKHTKEMDDQDKYYKAIASQLEEEFEAKQRQLTEKIQSLNAKLNSFDEVRRQREEYVRRQEMLKKIMDESALRHKEEIYEAEKQAIIEQDKLQKDMEKRLEHLAWNFREVTDVRIGETTNSIIGENIKLGNMLTCQQEFLTKVTTEYKHMKKIHYNAALELELKEDEYNMTYMKFSKHAGKIEELLQTLDYLTKTIEELKKLIKINRKLRRKIAEMECFIRESTDEYDALRNSLEETEKVTTNAKLNLRDFQKKIILLQLSLFEAAKKVKQAIECENIVITDESILQNTEEPIVKKDSTEIQEAEKENMYVRRELLIEEITLKLHNEIINADELHLMAPSTESYSFNFSYRSDHSLPSKRSSQKLGVNEQ